VAKISETGGGLKPKRLNTKYWTYGGGLYQQKMGEKKSTGHLEMLIGEKNNNHVLVRREGAGRH
jgi:hypothetical protein